MCLQRKDFWNLGLNKKMESNIGNSCFKLVEEAARRHEQWLMDRGGEDGQSFDVTLLTMFGI